MNTQPNDGGPAFPCHTNPLPGKLANAPQGMTLREYAAIELRVPNSGINWLDDMIRQSQFDHFAGEALAGLLASSRPGYSFGTARDASEEAYRSSGATAERWLRTQQRRCRRLARTPCSPS